MLKDEDLQYNMALYMGIMTENYQSTKLKRKQIQILLNKSASKIQNKFRKWRKNKKINACLVIQKWWKKIIKINKYKLLVKKRLNYLYNGLIITNFMKKICKKIKVVKKQKYFLKPGQQQQREIKLAQKQKIFCISKIFKLFPAYITKKSALISQYKYISKYQQYLRKKFNEDWDKYQKKVSKQLWKQIDRKWVKVDKKVKVIKGVIGSKQSKQTSNIYLNDLDKQINAEEYIQNRLNKMYEESYEKLQNNQLQLRRDQKQIENTLKYIQYSYAKDIQSPK